ncbi:MAG: CD225/dispanin family protein [Prolixibacteraceae bacterium]|jgi:hypothetical protein|nr:CD225/dispanin family protein [Prolixibacteraceae bacterium]MBT6763594.1 CD225/dispanin family protein [Prolixibacteraceae bacterium]MBT6998717.1 CD225/dispanin family protein [Prolixibacteraceae bacterium]MBT7395317.1 CD225/dispanin family protein [Prolixibacteraceae bacterium]
MNEQQVQQPQSPPPNYLVWAILTTILCCLPFGIVSIIFAAQVNSKWVAGDFTGAQNASKNAKVWAWVSFAVGISVAVIYLIAILALGVTAFWADSFS